MKGLATRMNYFPFLALFLFLALEPHSSMQQDAVISITPEKASTNDNVEFVCRNNRQGSAAVYFALVRLVPLEDSSETVVRLDVKCAPSVEILKQTNSPGFDSVKFGGCESMTVTGVLATRAIAGKYRCEIQYIMMDFSQSTVKTQPIDLTVGDTTPRVTRFEVANAATGELASSSDGVAAGTNVSVTCETDRSDPVPEFTISADGARLGQPVRPPAGAESRVVQYVLVPKTPRIVYRCSAYNGFGVEQTAEVAVTVVYGAAHSEVSTPKEATLQTTEEIEICSVANNPPRQLRIADLDSSLLQPNYPRFEQKDGYSRAYVKLADAASSVKALTFACGMDGIDTPVKGSVQLVGVEAVTTQAPSSAMMTIGIVIAVVVVFILIVAGVAVALKRRSAANKASNGDNARYGKVNQNDADAHHPTYESNPAGKKPIKVCDSANEVV